MKKIIVVIFLSSCPLWAANALLESYARSSSTEVPNPVQRRWNIVVSYQGPDVPGDTQRASLSVIVSTSATGAQIQSAIVSVIQTEATNRGFTVLPGSTILPTMTFQ